MFERAGFDPLWNKHLYGTARRPGQRGCGDRGVAARSDCKWNAERDLAHLEMQENGHERAGFVGPPNSHGVVTSPRFYPGHRFESVDGH